MKNLLNQLIKGRIFGHPVHMMLVHFPIAFFLMSAFLALLSIILNNHTLAQFDFIAAAAGSLMGWAAISFGTIDLLNIRNNKEAYNKALIHGGLNTLWVMTFTVLAGIKFKYYPGIPLPSIGEVAIKFAVNILMIYSSYLGGELMLRYNLGIDYIASGKK